jgi:glyoxylase-like metal-dependent hydrolase (beta-lactamase superfamily II)
MRNYIRLNLGITKVYLLPCTNGYLLIDTGYETDYKKFRNKLEKAGVKIAQIKYLLLTHYRPIYYSNLDQTYKSIQKLISAGTQTILPAHGNPFPVKKLKNMLSRFTIG